MDLYVEVLYRIKHQYRLKEQELGLLDDTNKKSEEKVSVKNKKTDKKKKTVSDIGSKNPKPFSSKPKQEEITINREPPKSMLNQKEKAAVMKMKMEKIPNNQILKKLNITEEALSGVLEECEKYGIKF